MAGGGEDKHSKKHPASAKKKRDLKKKGQVPKSQDVPMVVGLLAAFGTIWLLAETYVARFDTVMTYYFEALVDVKSSEGIDPLALLLHVLVDVAWLTGPVMFAVLVFAVLSHLAQSGLIITGEQMKPNLNKINPTKKLKQWFSIKSAQELFKSLAKILMAAIIGWWVWKGFYDDIAGAVVLDALGLLGLGAQIIKQLFIFIVILYVVVAFADYAFQRRNFANDNKMSDKEVKDEYKNSEGDPHQKGKRKQVAREMSQQASQSAAPQGDVVVVNPTELAISIAYDPEVSPVPYVVAKGDRRHADDIRDSARKGGIPVVRNKPLARALFEMCEIGDIVPEELYRAVAEVLAFVFALREEQAAHADQGAAAEQAASAASTQPAAAAAATAATATTANAAATAAAATTTSQDPSAAAASVGATLPPQDADGVHDLQGVQVPVLPAGAPAGSATSGASPAHAGTTAGAAVSPAHAGHAPAAQPHQGLTAPAWQAASHPHHPGARAPMHANAASHEDPATSTDAAGAAAGAPRFSWDDGGGE